MTDLTNPGLELATALEGIEQLRRERAEYQHEYKRSMDRLVNDVARLRGEIISGQKRLFELEAAEAESDSGKPTSTAEFSCVVDFCREHGRASVSDLCQKFTNMTSGRAVHLIDMMDARGYLEPVTGSGPRKFKEPADGK